jgi:hypothetical protein
VVVDAVHVPDSPSVLLQLPLTVAPLIVPVTVPVPYTPGEINGFHPIVMVEPLMLPVSRVPSPVLCTAAALTEPPDAITFNVPEAVPLNVPQYEVVVTPLAACTPATTPVVAAVVPFKVPLN